MDTLSGEATLSKLFFFFVYKERIYSKAINIFSYDN